MSKISLRAYNQEIEALVNQGRTDEAIVHCRQILRLFPKHVDTYRLLGKAYLQGQHYADAVDIFQRLLSAVPDDFVAQLGMSIIREDEGKLDAAIWHMERAFEIQPFNNAIQEELKRLYERRDKVAPPKIRLNRSALARMYAKGDLYQQAIAELRNELAKDPQRAELQILLAKMYHRSGKRVEAAETASLLLKKYPFCLEANRILADILKDTDRADEVEAYRQRVIALDPYEKHISPEAPSSERVPEEAVSLEKSEIQASDVASITREQSDWMTSLGIEAEEFSGLDEDLPEWLVTASQEQELESDQLLDEAVQETPVESETLEVSGQVDEEGLADWLEGAEEELTEETAMPDWMVEAGWQPAGEALEKAEEALEADVDAEISKAELPDWLVSMAPEIAEDDEEIEDSDLASLISGVSTPGLDAKIEAEPADELPDWLREFEQEPAQEAEEEATGVPEGTQEELPDWLQEIVEEEELDTPLESQPEPAEAELPDWLQEQTPISDSEDELPEWLAGIGEPEGSSLAEPESEDVEPADEGLPEWLTEFDRSAATMEEPPTESSEVLDETEGELPEWLEEFVDEVPESTFETTPAEEPVGEGELPEWLQGLGEMEPEVEPEQTLAAAEGAMPEPTETEIESFEPTEELQPSGVVSEWQEEVSEIELESPPDFEDMDAAVAWLENLAAKHGVSEEEITTAPEEQPEQPPEWVQEAISEADETVTALDETKILMDFTDEIQVEDQIAPVDEEAAGQVASEQDQPAEIEAEAAYPQEEGLVELESPPDFEDMQAAIAWLEGLASKHGVGEEELTTAPEELPEQAPEWVQEMEPEAEEVAEVVAETGEIEAIQTEESGISEWEIEVPDEETAVSAEEIQPEGELEEIAEKTLESAGVEAGLESVEQPEAEELVEPEIPAWIIEADRAEAEHLEEEQLEATEELQVTEAVPQSALEEEITEPEFPAEEVVTEQAPEKLDINQASLVELERIPGIGFRLAQSIVTYRETNGLFENVDDLLSVPGLGPATLDNIRNFVEIDAQPEIEMALPRAAVKPKDFLTYARRLLDQGEFSEAIDNYQQLLQKNELVSDVIFDLKQALNKFTENFELWQALGDAYMRDDQLQEALEAYQAAEDLL